MDNLFCNEVCLITSPTATPDQRHARNYHCDSNTNYNTRNFYNNKEDCEEAFKMYLKKELTYMPESGYVDRLQSEHFINIARCKAIHWFIQSRIRLNLSLETVSNATNYLDRFISLDQCHGWKCWMFELLSIACLSIASKFGETAPPALHDIQMEGLENAFQPRLIQEMELKLLQTLDWRLNCTTPYSYVELMKWDIIDFLIKPLLVDDLFMHLIELLLCALLDYKLIHFRPSVITVCALKRVLESLIPSTCDAHLPHFTAFIPQDQMDDLIKCRKIMMREQLVIDNLYNVLASDHLQTYPSSPVTVLPMECVEGCDRQVDFSLFKKMPSLNESDKSYNNKKRKRTEQHE